MRDRDIVVSSQDVQGLIDALQDNQREELRRLVEATGAMPGRELPGRPHDISIA